MDPAEQPGGRPHPLERVLREPAVPTGRARQIAEQLHLPFDAQRRGDTVQPGRAEGGGGRHERWGSTAARGVVRRRPRPRYDAGRRAAAPRGRRRPPPKPRTRVHHTALGGATPVRPAGFAWTRPPCILMSRDLPAYRRVRRTAARWVADVDVSRRCDGWRVKDSFGAKGTLEVGDQSYADLPARPRSPATASTSSSLPFSLKVLLENLLRTEDGADITADDIRALAGLGRRGRARQGDPVHAGARDHAGLHRRAVHRRPGHHARGDGRPRRRRHQDQPARARPSWSSTTP